MSNYTAYTDEDIQALVEQYSQDTIHLKPFKKYPNESYNVVVVRTLLWLNQLEDLEAALSDIPPGLHLNPLSYDVNQLGDRLQFGSNVKGFLDWYSTFGHKWLESVLFASLAGTDTASFTALELAGLHLQIGVHQDQNGFTPTIDVQFDQFCLVQ